MQGHTQRKFLLFEINHTPLALDLSAVSEVADPLPVWPVPFAPSLCSGAIHIHGSIYAVIDLASVLGEQISSFPEKMIILDKSVAGLVILASRAFKIVNENDLEAVETPVSDFFTSTLIMDGRGFGLLDVYKIVQLSEDIMKSKQLYS